MDGLTFYPISVSKAKAISSKDEGIVTFVYHTATMTNRDFDVFEKLFDRADVVSYDEFFKYDPQPRGLKEATWEYMTARAKYYAVRIMRNVGKK